ncbi:MAG TPA: hypothetical protein VGJ36_08120 [Gemmatimonadales bacterium]|jgi:hypothetical protein
MIRDLPAYLRRISRAVTWAIALGAALPARAQTGASPAPTAIMQERLDAETAAAVQAVIDSAVADGLPARPLVSKALEGSAKHAAATRIVGAVRLLSADLAVVRDALGGETGEQTLIAGVGALRAGVAPGYLSRLREARPEPEVAWPLTILADLVSRGVPVDTAAGVVLDLARAGASDASYSALQEQVRRDVSVGVPPGTAAAARAAAAATDPSAKPSAPPTHPAPAGAPARPARPNPPRP